ncbi:MAG: glucosyltransferase domain-containing protein [Lachnospiraceae bacterium]|nr:glucosyltransferase domain-containing protein [Lachnospiraceae bacterium]
MKTTLKKYIPLYIIDLMILTVFWGGLLRTSYNADTVAHIADPEYTVLWRIMCGRYFTALLEKIQIVTGIIMAEHLPVTILSTLMVVAFNAVLIQHIFSDIFDRIQLDSAKQFVYKAGFILCTSLVFLNVFFSEFLMFGEFCMYMALAYLFFTIGICFYIRGSVRNTVIAVVFFLLAVYTYQSSAILGALILVVYYMVKNNLKWTKTAVKDEILAVLFPMGAGVVNLVSTKIAGMINPQYAFFRDVEVGTLSGKLATVASNFLLLNKSSYNLLPGVFIPGLFSLFTVIGIIYILTKREDKKSILYFITAYVICIILMYSLPFLESPFSFPPRMALFFYLVQGLTGVTIYYLLFNEKQISDTTLNRFRMGFSVIVIGYLWIQLIFSQFIISGRYVSNTMDNVFCRSVLLEIEKHEEETGSHIDYLCVFNDDYSPTYYRESSIHTDQINERIIGQATCSYIDAVLGRHFEPLVRDAMPDDIYSEYFEGKDWDQFDVSEQLVIVGDTAYLCVY